VEAVFKYYLHELVLQEVVVVVVVVVVVGDQGPEPRLRLHCSH
jgi:hypothetical protein